MGSPAVAAWVAYIAFWLLLVYGGILGELRGRGLVVFVALWLAGLFGLRKVPYEPVHAMFSSFVAILDIALVFAIFKGDVRLTSRG